MIVSFNWIGPHGIGLNLAEYTVFAKTDVCQTPEIIHNKIERPSMQTMAFNAHALVQFRWECKVHIKWCDGKFTLSILLGDGHRFEINNELHHTCSLC